MNNYESPIKFTQDTVVDNYREVDNAILFDIKTKFDVDVDKEGLIKALQYDREQYEKGYEDAKTHYLKEITLLQRALTLACDTVHSYDLYTPSYDHKINFMNEAKEELENG